MPHPFIKDSRGSVAVIFGVTTFVALVAAGAAVDYGRAFSTRSALQVATDAAAVSAAAADPDSDRIDLATTVFHANYPGSAAADLNVATSSDKVMVTASAAVGTTLLAMAGITELAVAAISEAKSSANPSPALCILLLEKTEIGLYANSDSRLDASCAVHINSNNAEALYVNSNSHITASDVCVVGSSKLNGGTVTPSPTHGCPEKADPMLSLPEPAEASLPCNYTDFTVNNGQTKTMWPGVYCKKTLINSGGNAIMLPGVYVFREGEFSINSLATVTGSEVMMFFKDKDARLNVNSGSTFKVTAPKSGTYQGVLMFQSRHPDTLSAPPHIVNADGNTELEGTLYVANGVFELTSLSVANEAADYTIIIARQMVLNSNGLLQVKCNLSGNTPLPPLLAGFKGTTSARLVR